MRKLILVLFAALSLTLGLVGTASADHFPTQANPNACVGRSSVASNIAFQDADSGKFRDEQARGETYLDVPAGERGRQDEVRAIPECEGVR